MYLFKTFKKNQISLLKFESSFTKLTQKKISIEIFVNLHYEKYYDLNKFIIP
jgi:hypothetical protein